MNVLNEIFFLDKKTIILLLNKLCEGKFNDLEINEKNCKIHKELVDDFPTKITISLYGKIIIDSKGINYKGEHGYQNTQIVEFNEFFNLEGFLNSLEHGEDDFFIKNEQTQRGYGYLEFKERNGAVCSIQKSSSATDDCIWLGAKKFGIQEFKAGSGWIDRTDLDEYKEDHHFVGNNRMHLTIDMVEKILPVLQHFVATGEVKL